MFIVHNYSAIFPTKRDFGHVNQFLRENPLFRQAKNEPIFMECIEQGEIHIKSYERSIFKQGNQLLISYHRTMNELLKEVMYNRNNQDVDRK